MVQLNLILSWWLISILAGTLLIFIYPLTFDSCPLSCTIIETERGCRLASSTPPIYYGGHRPCQNVTVACYAYHQTITYRGSEYTEHWINVTQSKFKAQLFNAMDVSIVYQIFGWGAGIAIPACYTIILVVFSWTKRDIIPPGRLRTSIRQPYLKQRYYSPVSTEDREPV